jgi:hypothetical protein
MASAVYLGPQEVSAGQMPGSPVDLECVHESSRRPHKPAPPAHSRLPTAAGSGQDFSKGSRGKVSQAGGGGNPGRVRRARLRRGGRGGPRPISPGRRAGKAGRRGRPARRGRRGPRLRSPRMRSAGSAAFSRSPGPFRTESQSFLGLGEVILRLTEVGFTTANFAYTHRRMTPAQVGPFSRWRERQ